MLVALDARLRARSVVAWFLFRATAGFFCAFGLFLWVGLWLQRSTWLGIAMAAQCVLALASELGILPAGVERHDSR
jgi:hypothetical protein